MTKEECLKEGITVYESLDEFYQKVFETICIEKELLDKVDKYKYIFSKLDKVFSNFYIEDSLFNFDKMFIEKLPQVSARIIEVIYQDKPQRNNLYIMASFVSLIQEKEFSWCFRCYSLTDV